MSTTEQASTKLDSHRLLLVLSCEGLAGLSGWLLGGYRETLLLIIVVAPTAIALSFKFRHGADYIFVAVSFSYTVFMGAGVMSWSLRDYTLGAFRSGQAPFTEVLTVVSLLSALALTFSVALRASAGPARLPSKIDDLKPVIGYAYSIALACSIGLVLLIENNGGLSSLSESLVTHDKESVSLVASSASYSVWATLSLPAVVAAAALIGYAEGVGHKVLGGAFLLAFGVVSILVFGSRLAVILGAIASGCVIFSSGSRRLQARYVVGFAIGFLIISSSVLQTRSEALSADTRDSSVAVVLDDLGYSIFNVSMAGWLVREDLGPRMLDVEAIPSIALSSLPFGASDEVSRQRVDVVTVQAIGTSEQARSTGLPPSLPTATLIAFGIVGAFPVIAAAGALFGLLLRLLCLLNSGLGVVLYGSLAAAIFNIFKGGDLYVDTSVEARRWIYTSVFYLLILIGTFVLRRQRVPT